MSQALIAPAYAEITRAYRHFRLLNGSLEALEFVLDPAVTGASLGTWLATPANHTAFLQLVAAPQGFIAIAASSTAMAAVFAQPAARVAIYDSDTAWGAVVVSAAVKAYMLSLASTSSTAGESHVQVNATRRSVLLQQKISNRVYSSFAGAMADTYATTSEAYIDRYVRVTGLSHRSSSVTTTSSITWLSME